MPKKKKKQAKVVDVTKEAVFITLGACIIVGTALCGLMYEKGPSYEYSAPEPVYTICPDCKKWRT